MNSGKHTPSVDKRDAMDGLLTNRGLKWLRHIDSLYRLHHTVRGHELCTVDIVLTFAGH
jgi:hypothetical protein